MLKVFCTNEFATNQFGASALGTGAIESRKWMVGEFKSYEEFSRFIMKRSHYWSFIVHSPMSVKEICHSIRPECVTLSETIALEKCCGLIEIRRGNIAPLRQIVITPEVDIEMFRKSWCREYSEAQSYTVFEISLLKDDHAYISHPQQGFSSTILPFLAEKTGL
jgi:hypothetical protein